jgi:predicted MPP superfamily phosphohydrolase
LLKNKLIKKIAGALSYWAWGIGLIQFQPKSSEYNSGEKYLYTSNGIATHPPLRIFCPPELTVITI